MDFQDSRGFLGIPGDSKGLLRIRGDSRGFSGIQRDKSLGFLRILCDSATILRDYKGFLGFPPKP